MNKNIALRKLITKDWIVKNYINKTISVSALASSIGTNRTALNRIIREQGFDIKSRNIVQSGVNNPFYGKHHSDETKAKMKGVRPHTSGTANHNWKISAYHRGYLWREYIRPTILKRDKFKCTMCGSDKHLIIHHIIPYEQGNDNSKKNLVTLCRGCHLKVHNVN